MMAEIFGRKTGYCKGKGGSMHIADFSIGMLGANGIVGAGLPIATGAATAAQLEDKGGVAAVFFGDGACQEGEFHETMNMASVWKLPLIFVCENNLYAAFALSKPTTAIDELYKRAAAYSMPGVVVDGNDVVAVHDASKDLIDRARKGKGPAFLECRTYRWHGHFETRNPMETRPAEEVAYWKARCPVATMEKKLQAAGVLTDAQLEEMDRQILVRIDDAVEFAVNSPFPAPEDALEDVYSA